MKAGSMSMSMSGPGMRLCFRTAATVAIYSAAESRAATPGFWAILPPIGERLDIKAISANGEVAAGLSIDPSKPLSAPYRAFRWTRTEGIVEVPGSEPHRLVPLALDMTGQRVAGLGTYPDHQSIAWYQDGTTPAVSIAPLPDPRLTSGTGNVGLSRDGTILAGTFSVRISGSRTIQRAYRWTQATGPVPLDALGSDRAEVSAMSGDGRTIIGAIDTSNIGVTWKDGGAPERLPMPSFGLGWGGSAINNNGDFIAGSASTTTSTQMVIWSRGVPEVIFNPSGLVRPGPMAITDDGQMVALNLTTVDGVEVPHVWQRKSGFTPLATYISDFGITAEPGFTFRHLAGMTPDGTTFTGWGINALGETAGFVVTVPNPGIGGSILASACVFASRRRRNK